jgi:2-dehydropantoate 2-reductase
VLHAAGNEVIHFVRPGRANQFARGVHIRLLDGRESQQTEYEVDYPIQVTERLSPHDGFDLYLVSVRHYQLPSILPLVAANAGTADVLFFNNLWTGPEPIDAALPRSTYLWGFPTAGGGFIDGMLDAALLDDIHLGEIDGTRSPRLARIAGVFQNARVASDVRTDIVHWQWVHFAINAGVVGTALKVGSASALLDNAEVLQQAVLAVRDALEVCRARGVDIDHSEDAAPFFGPVEQVAAGIQALYQQNRAARKIMECHTSVDDLVHIYQDVLVTGRALGVNMPHLAALEPAVVASERTAEVATNLA